MQKRNTKILILAALLASPLSPVLDRIRPVDLICTYSLACCPEQQITVTVAHGTFVTVLSVKLCGTTRSKTVPNSDTQQVCACLLCCSTNMDVNICGSPSSTWGAVNSCSDMTVTCTVGCP